MTFYDRALSGDKDTFATRVLAFELEPAHRQIHVETLLCLLRDAYQQRNPGAVSFVRPFLDGLLPAHTIAAYEQSLSSAILGALEPTPTQSPQSPTGGLKVESAKPTPTMPPAAARVAPRQSSTLSW